MNAFIVVASVALWLVIGFVRSLASHAQWFHYVDRHNPNWVAYLLWPLTTIFHPLNIGSEKMDNVPVVAYCSTDTVHYTIVCTLWGPMPFVWTAVVMTPYLILKGLAYGINHLFFMKRVAQ